tara:strand:+ start:173 stop:988 length:816 start_codon:yes stop_codon:yes gene_type:complete
MAVAVVACFRFGPQVVGVFSLLPLLGVVSGILPLELAIVLAPFMGVLAAIQIAKGKSYGQVVVAAGVPAMLYGLYLVVMLPDKMSQVMELNPEQFHELQESGVNDALIPLGLSIQDVFRFLILVQPGIEVVYLLLILVLGYSFARYLGMKTNVVVIPTPTFVREWRLWDQIIWVLVFGVAVVLFTEEGWVYGLGVNILLVSFVLYMVQGFSVVRFYLWRWRVMRVLQFLLFVVAIITGWAGLLLAVMGLLDTWFDWRRLRHCESRQEEVEQ